MLIDVDGGTYVSACSELYDCNHGIIDAVSTLNSGLGSGGSMAGSDTGGEEWGTQYDQVATKLVQAGCDLGEAMGQSANLLNASLKNHEGADYGARISGPPIGTADDGDPDPNHWTETLSPAGVPSAKGGVGGQPGWWHWIAGHLEGLFWPDADTGKMRTIGQAWVTAGTTVGAYASAVDSAKYQVQTQKSPEIPDAVAALGELEKHTTDLADAYRQMGKACNDYAQHVDDHHQMIEDELASFIKWTIAIEAGGAVVGFFTLGLGEGAAQAAEATEVANAASRVVKILRALVELAKTVAETIGTLLTKVTQILADLKKFLNAKAIAALEKVGVTVGKAKVGATLAKADLNATQLTNLARYTKKLPAGAEETAISRAADGAVQFETKVPGRVPGSYALYTKTVDEAGTTIGYTKTTIAPDGSVVSVKNKLGP